MHLRFEVFKFEIYRFGSCYLFPGALRPDAMLTLLRRVPTASPDFGFLKFMVFSLLWYFSDLELKASVLSFIRPCGQACLRVGRFGSCCLVLVRA
ncbi:hypothetical protein [Agriterribacter sp.]|uniref:hypothetical protein n=1 Tax=Agriterribacter sp. TaxID=2821509 RepID=UPI002C025A3C|nr:hypothetical protein [Agriterribacter sp.]HRP57518.1 hypothetical protein [Agriterribacter sp.]